MYSFAFCLFIELPCKKKRNKNHIFLYKKKKKKNAPAGIWTGELSITYHSTEWQVVEPLMKWRVINVFVNTNL